MQYFKPLKYVSAGTISHQYRAQDPQDVRIIDDSWPAMDGTRVIAAWGSTSSIAYHGPTNRVASQVLLRKSDIH